MNGMESGAAKTASRLAMSTLSWKREPRVTLERRVNAAMAPSVCSSTLSSSTASSTYRRCA